MQSQNYDKLKLLKLSYTRKPSAKVPHGKDIIFNQQIFNEGHTSVITSLLRKRKSFKKHIEHKQWLRMIQ